MKFLSMLIRRGEPPWWELRSSEGDPASEKVGLYILPALLSIIRTRLKHVENENAKVDP